MDDVSGHAHTIVKIWLAGSVRAASPSGYPLLPSSKKARAVLAILGLSKDHQCSRTLLATLLWDDASEDAARASLRQALHDLAKIFDAAAPGFLRINRDTVSLDRQRCWIDLYAFGAGHDDPRLELAELAELKPLRMLEDLNGLSASFDDWLRAERTAFEARLAAEMDRQLKVLESEASADRKTILIGQILKFDPTHERASRAMMRAYIEIGEIALAIKEFERCQKALRTNLDVEPSLKTKSLYRTIRATSVTPQKTADFVGYPPLPDRPSIAVLPFRNMSSDPEQEYFADGIVEDIITALSRFKSLFVIARSSSFTYKGKPVDTMQVGRELGVRYVLEGSVRKIGGTVRIAGQLINAGTGACLWADRFDGSLDNVFALQDKVTSNVAAAILPRLERAEIDRAECKPTESLDAVDLYYRALHAHQRVTRQGYDDALRFAQQAISQDANFASAYGLTLDCYIRQHEHGWITRDILVAKGSQYVSRAVEAGADDAFALARAANFFSRALGDARTGDAMIDRAIAINPNLALAWRIRGWIDVCLGQHELANDHCNYAMRLNPLDPEAFMVQTNLGWANFFLGRFEVALSWATRALALQKDYVSPMTIAIVSYAMLGRVADAQMMMAREREAGVVEEISKRRQRAACLFQRQDVDLFIEACRIAGLPE